jgi:hypothetical protein
MGNRVGLKGIKVDVRAEGCLLLLGLPGFFL